MSYAEAVGALADALDRGDRQYGAFVSGVVRWEVPLPRGVSALHWLQVSTFLGLYGFGQEECPGFWAEGSPWRQRLYISLRLKDVAV